jgi:acyl-CoA reductase-like NAD-dependent aldehyde dehydrogenase
MPKAFDAVERLEVGGVIVNDIPSFRVDQMPYGGVKNSGTGREGVKYSVEGNDRIKTSRLYPLDSRSIEKMNVKHISKHGRGN